MKIASIIDHTMLKADATAIEIEKLCNEAMEYNFKAVCVNPYYVEFAKSLLKDTEVKVATVVGFPLGASTKETKAFETVNAINNGADEIDMVINISALKNKEYNIVSEDIKAVVDSSNNRAIVKVIIETSLLTDEEKIKACEIAKISGADFVKTSTGFSTDGAKIEDITLMRKTIGEDMKIKASGGIRDYKTASAMVEAGADRIGASASIAIAVEENKQ